ncbi:MAG: AMP-binding protein [Clostridia bacterium]|nr:AMP-binding protein [Clostridia bacterium]
MSPCTDMSVKLQEVASRIRELREISAYSPEFMAEQTEVSLAEYLQYESGKVDLPFTFIHKCALIFDVDITDIMEGASAPLTSYTVTRAGQGKITAREQGIEIKNLAPYFKDKIGEPFWVRYSYSAEQQNKPIHLTHHSGQEFDLVISGKLKVQVGEHTEILNPGDSIFYNSSTPHGMIAIDGEDCVFCAVVLPGAESEGKTPLQSIIATKRYDHLIYEKFVAPVEDEQGVLQSISFHDDERFNFAFDVVDELARQKPDKLAMVHLDKEKNVRRFTFEDMSRASSRAANYFQALGIKPGDKVMLVLKRHYQFWVALLGLHKLGAVAIPATDQLLEHDFEYRFNKAGVSAILCTAEGQAAAEAEKAFAKSPCVTTRVIVGGQRPGWHDFDRDYLLYRSSFQRTEQTPGGDDTMLMFFTSGTTGYPKIAAHSYKYALGHFITAKYWQCCEPDGLHLTISDTGWGKALWGKLYGQWLCETAVFVYDFERFDAPDILSLFQPYQITSFCAPPTMYRFMIKEDLSCFDLSSIRYATTAGEALNPEVFHQFHKATGLSIMEGFGQTETTLIIANLAGTTAKIGSMGRPSPLFDVDLIDKDGKSVPGGETGEIIIRIDKGMPNGLFQGYYEDDNLNSEAWRGGVYHTGDTAWRDEDGYIWYVGRVDDLIKSSGYRIGPFEIESVIMELPYVLECGVSAAPDEVRGQVVKASIVLTRGAEPSEELKKEIQDYVKKHTAPYKYPRIVVFRDELPKTISGKIKRNQL